LAPDTPVTCYIVKPDREWVEFKANHSMSAAQIEWFNAGSALNIIRART
jgi:aconitate hydratase